jgi:hypothetical protein
MLSRDPSNSFGKTGVDEYGYKRSDYAGGMPQRQEETVSIADLSFFYDVNQFF